MAANSSHHILKGLNERSQEQLKDLVIEHVEQTNKMLGKGSFGHVEQLEISGLKCAGKTLHAIFFVSSEKEQAYIKQKFVEECVQHSKLRHPNIVQLLGICLLPGQSVPTMVLEFLHTTLAGYLECHSDIPLFFKHRILLDIVVGLRFLHERSPPILHRDLTGNNVLLTEDLRAKISDLGMARIIPPNNQSLTMAPGNFAFMPPESLSSSPQYTEKLDMFSFGVLILQVVLQSWPCPIKEATFNDPVKGLVPRSEVERREDFFSQLDPFDLLTQLARKCLDNDPEMRPTTQAVHKKLQVEVDNSARSYIGYLELFKELKSMKSDVCQILQNVDNDDKTWKSQLQSAFQSSQSGGMAKRQASNDGIQTHKLVFGLQHISSDKELTSSDAFLKVQSLSPSCPHPVSLTICRSFSHTFSGTFVKTIVTGLKRSLGLAVRSGILYVVDRDGWKGVHIYNIETGEVRSIVDSCSRYEFAKDGKCWGPSGIVLDSDSNIIISEFNNHRIAKFTPEGEFLKTSGPPYRPGNECGQFNQPLGLCHTKEGKVIVCDLNNHRIQVLNPDLTCEKEFGKKGHGDNEFINPRDVAVDSRGNIYVVDCGNFCIKVFDSLDYKFIDKFGERGSERDGFQYASSICIDKRDFIYVSDRSLHCVKIFDPNGVFKMSMEGSFQESFGIAVDESGRLFVSDSYNGKVHMYE